MAIAPKQVPSTLSPRDHQRAPTTRIPSASGTAIASQSAVGGAPSSSLVSMP
jgi:hypothetical protein